MIWGLNLEFRGCKFRVIVGGMYLHLELWFLSCILQLIYVSKLILNFNSPLNFYFDLSPSLSKLFYFHFVLHSIENFNFCSTWPLCKFQRTLGLGPFSFVFQKLQDEVGPFLECPLESSPSTNELSHLFMFNSTCEGPF